MKKFESFGGRKTKNGVNGSARRPGVLLVSSGPVEEFIERSRERARRLDRGEKIPSEIRMTFEDPADLIRVLSAERLRILRAVRDRPAAVSELSAVLKRDRKAVKRDVSVLESYGLVSAREEVNPGHGRKQIIEPRAARYQLMATI